MLRRLDASVLRLRSQFLRDVRAFFFARDYIEVETPLLNASGGTDPFLDPFLVMPSAPGHSVEAPAFRGGRGRLITSPEYNLKTLLADTDDHVFQIAHCFREGDAGGLHTEEFLMLEWYRRSSDEFMLMAECADLLQSLCGTSYAKLPWAPPRRRRVEEVFREYAGCGTARESLEEALEREGLLGHGEVPTDLRYDELFFSIFLNRIETRLGRGAPEFLHHYPADLAALARTEDNIARRFEIYWEGIELANGYYELNDPQEQVRRFHAENKLRRSLGKQEMDPAPQFVQSLEGIGDVSGIALGLDRLLMLISGAEDLAQVSPFPTQAF